MSSEPNQIPYPWYSHAVGAELEQGDILLNCPVLTPPSGGFGEGAIADVQLRRRVGIVMSQSCDLAVRPNGKSAIAEVVFCSVFSRGELANDQVFSMAKVWENARKGRLPAYHVLNRCDLSGCERDCGLVDFTRVFTVDIKVVQELALNQTNRLRLNPPYREHLAQAFARFFMRVGLPVDIPAFT